MRWMTWRAMSGRRYLHCQARGHPAAAAPPAPALAARRHSSPPPGSFNRSRFELNLCQSVPDATEST